MGCCCGVPRPRAYDRAASYLVQCADAASARALAEATLPPGAAEIPAAVAGRVAVFYVHPTLHFLDPRCNVWSEPSPMLKEDLKRAQLGPFLGFGPVFAPYYREATIMGYSFRSARATQALELAYSDVERAFDRFLAEIPTEMPFFVVGHSQGSDHLVKLFARRFGDQSSDFDRSVAQRIVCAYLGGVVVGEDTFAGLRGIRLASGPHDVGGAVVAWASVAGRLERSGLASGLHRSDMNPYSYATQRPRLANPITWAVGEGEHAAPEAHLGALCGGRLLPRACGCDVRAGVCAATEMAQEARALPHLGEDYHLCDFELWWQCIRANAIERASAALGEGHGRG